MKLSNIIHLNWPATLGLNYRIGGIGMVLRMPVKVYGRLKWHLSGRIVLPPDAVRCTLIIGSDHEDYTASAGKAELSIKGTWEIGGVVRIGPDCFIGVQEGATLSMGGGSFFGRDTQIHCSNRITFGEGIFTGELYATDSSEHVICLDGKRQSLAGSIFVGQGCYLAARTTLLKGCAIPPESVVATGAVCTHDYTREHAGNILLTGVPATVKRTGVKAIL